MLMFQFVNIVSGISDVSKLINGRLGNTKFQMVTTEFYSY